MARLNNTQIYLQNNPFSGYHQDLETNLQKELMEILYQEELLWRTKSRCDIMEEGDQITRYFHRSVLIKRSRSRILCLRDEVGNDVINPIDISAHILDFYTKLYSSKQVQCSFTCLDHPGDPSQ